MIPKVIHFIWLGKGKYPKNIARCIESWYFHNPEFKIMKWDENNIPKDIYFVNYMIGKKQWAFASDCLRFWVLYHYGGIYLDTDMLVFKNLKPLIENNSLFFGKENKNIVSGGIIGSRSENNLIKECLNFYLELNELEKLIVIEKNKILIPEIITSVIKENFNIANINNLEKFDNLVLYPTEYFYPISFIERKNVFSFIPNNKNNYAIHLWEASWHDEYQNLQQKRYVKSLKIYFSNLISGSYNFIESIKYIKRVIHQIIKIIFTK